MQHNHPSHSEVVGDDLPVDVVRVGRVGEVIVDRGGVVAGGGAMVVVRVMVLKVTLGLLVVDGFDPTVVVAVIVITGMIAPLLCEGFPVSFPSLGRA